MGDGHARQLHPACRGTRGSCRTLRRDRILLLCDRNPCVASVLAQRFFWGATEFLYGATEMQGRNLSDRIFVRRDRNCCFTFPPIEEAVLLPRGLMSCPQRTTGDHGGPPVTRRGERTGDHGGPLRTNHGGPRGTTGDHWGPPVTREGGRTEDLRVPLGTTGDHGGPPVTNGYERDREGRGAPGTTGDHRLRKGRGALAESVHRSVGGSFN